MPFLQTQKQQDPDFDWEPVSAVDWVDAAGDEAPGESASESPSDERVRVAVRALRHMQEQLSGIIDTLEGTLGQGHDEPVWTASSFSLPPAGIASGHFSANDRVVEGVFDGERMVGADGMRYVVPPNYASKSKLVEGDVMKLTIKDDGAFIYKQIRPAERDRVTGRLAQDERGNFVVVLPDGHGLRVLTASVTYFKGQVGDEVVGFVPKGQSASWMAVEHILKGV